MRKITLLLIACIGLASFKLIEAKLFEFSYPKGKKIAVTLKADGFNQFTKEWRGSDYYYYSESNDHIICSVLYFKLNKDEQKLLVEPFGDAAGPAMPLVYFTEESNLKKYETNNKSWGEMTDDFMFRQNDIEEFEGKKIKQKHMYGYALFGKDMFLNVHLSKVNCSASDSTAMREILKSLAKKK